MLLVWSYFITISYHNRCSIEPVPPPQSTQLQMEFSLFFIFLFAWSPVRANEWIVSPTENCGRSNCHNLSYYTDDPSLYFSTDTTLIFLEGVHYLYEPVTISGVSNLTLQGEGVLQDGSHWTVRESTVVINCSNSEAGLFFVNWTGITINNITLESCGAQITSDPTLVSDINTHYSSFPYGWEFGVRLEAHHSLLFVNGSDLTLESVTIQRGTGYGLTIVNSYDIDINGSYFHLNFHLNGDTCNGGNIRIVHIPVPSISYCPYVKEDSSVLTISNTIASYGCNYIFQFNEAIESMPVEIRFLVTGFGGGIGLVAADYKCNRYRYELNSVILANNIATAGANLALIVLPVPITMKQVTSEFAQSEFHGSGLLFASFLPLHSISELIIQNTSTSSDNIAHNGRGAGIYIVTYVQESWSQISIQSCSFHNNHGVSGSGIYIESRGILVFNRLNVSLINVVLSRNAAIPRDDLSQEVIDATVTLINIDCVIDGLSIADSIGTRGLSLITSNVYVRGDNVISNNIAPLGSGGGVHLDPYSYFIFQPPANLSFLNNHADEFGGGIYILPRLNRTIQFPCFIQIESPSPTPDVRLYADGNTADITGKFIYGGDFLYCTFVTNFFYSFCRNETSFYCSYNVFQRIFNMSNENDSRSISSAGLAVALCNDDDINKSRNYFVTATAGRAFHVNLLLISETDGITIGTLRAYYSNGPTPEFQEPPNSAPNLTEFVVANCTPVEFVVHQYTLNENVSISLYSTVLVNYFYESFTPLVITVEFEECPPLFELMPTNNSNGLLSCECNSYLMETNANCNINSSTITSDPQNRWIGYNHDDICTYTGDCPFGYCVDEEVTFTINDIDAQCAHDRSGVLCGGCAEGFSIKLGSNECGQCSNRYLSLLLVFGIAGVVLVIFLILLNLTVTIGTINGLIFYANIVKILEPILFETDRIPVLSQFISWINLDFGINVCFYDGMTPSHKIWWQFAFPIYIWIIIGIITIAVKKMTNHRFFEPITRYFIHLKLVNVFATLLFLSYTKLIQTLVNIFNRTTVECDGEAKSVWYYDGTLDYAKGDHLPMFLFGIGFSCVVIIPYTLFLFALPLVEKGVAQLLEKCQCFGRLWLKIKPLTDAYASPFKDSCRFWVGFLIVIRLVVSLVYATQTDDTYVIYIVFTIILFTLMFSVSLEGPYTNRYLNILEHWFLVNLLGIIAYSRHPQVGVGIFHSLVFATSILIVIWHCYARWSGDFELNPVKILKSFKKSKMRRYAFKNAMNEATNGELEIEASSTDRTTTKSTAATTKSTPTNSSSIVTTSVISVASDSSNAVGVSRLKLAPAMAGYRDSALDLDPPEY